MEALHPGPPPSQPGIPPYKPDRVPPAPRTNSQHTSQTSPSPQDNPESSIHTSDSGIVGHDTSWCVSRIK